MDIWQITFSNTFSWLKKYVFWFKLHKNCSKRGLIDSKSAMMQGMTWCITGNKPLPEPMFISCVPPYIISKPQWVNDLLSFVCENVKRKTLPPKNKTKKKTKTKITPKKLPKNPNKHNPCYFMIFCGFWFGSIRLCYQWCWVYLWLFVSIASDDNLTPLDH